MAEYKREIGTALTVAFVLAFLLGAVAIYSFPLPSSYPSSNRSTNQVTTTQQSSTIPLAQTYTSQAVTFDSRLSVIPIQGLLEKSGNATEIAEALASNLDELPIQLLFHRPATCVESSNACTESTYPYSTAIDLYLFKSAIGSNITVDLIQHRFFELQYVVKDYSNLYNGYLGNHTGLIYPPPSPAVASMTVGNLMFNSFGIDLSKVSLVDNITGPIWVQLSQEYRGLSVSNSGVVYFEFYPPTSQVIRLVIDENGGWQIHPPSTADGTNLFLLQYGGWHLIPPNFTLEISPSAALNSAKSYANETLHMGSIGYAKISLLVIQNHMYYAATISNQSVTYILFVNPTNGEVGFPQA